MFGKAEKAANLLHQNKGGSMRTAAHHSTTNGSLRFLWLALLLALGALFSAPSGFARKGVPEENAPAPRETLRTCDGNPPTAI